MKAGNVKLMAAAAVVIVLCLLFAIDTYDDGDDDGTDTWRTDVHPGDYITMSVTETMDGESVTYEGTQKVLAVTDDGLLIQYSVDGEPRAVQWITVEDFFITEMPTTGPIGSETLQTPFGERECDIYEQTVDGTDYTVWYCGDIGYRVQYEYDGVSVSQGLVGNSMFSPEPPAAEQADVKDVEAGDWMEFTLTVYDGKAVVSQTSTRQDVLSVADGTVTVSETSDGVTMEAEYPLEVFLNGMWTDLDVESIGDGVFPLGGSDIACGCFSATDSDFDFTLLMVDGLTLMTTVESNGQLMVLEITGTNLIV